jgi:hypothetical protein
MVCLIFQHVSATQGVALRLHYFRTIIHKEEHL